MSTTPTPDQLARSGASAIEAYFEGRGAKAVTAGDGRYTVYVPGNGATEDVQLSLASTPAARGILARAKARRVVPRDRWPLATLAINKWNRSSPLPHAVLATRGSGEQEVGVVLLEGYLPPSAELDADQVRRFVETLVSGSRQFWSSQAVRELTIPLAAPTSTGPAAGQ